MTTEVRESSITVEAETAFSRQPFSMTVWPHHRDFGGKNTVALTINSGPMSISISGLTTKSAYEIGQAILDAAERADGIKPYDHREQQRAEDRAQEDELRGI